MNIQPNQIKHKNDIEIVHGNNDFGGVDCGNTLKIIGVGEEEQPAKRYGKENLKNNCTKPAPIRISDGDFSVYVCQQHIQEGIEHIEK